MLELGRSVHPAAPARHMQMLRKIVLVMVAVLAPVKPVNAAESFKIDLWGFFSSYKYLLIIECC